MRGENMLKKEVFDYPAGVAVLRRGHTKMLYFEQIVTGRHKFVNNSG